MASVPPHPARSDDFAALTLSQASVLESGGHLDDEAVVDEILPVLRGVAELMGDPIANLLEVLEATESPLGAWTPELARWVADEVRLCEGLPPSLR